MPHNNDNGGIYKSTSDTVQGKMLTSSNDDSIKNYPEPYVRIVISYMYYGLGISFFLHSMMISSFLNNLKSLFKSGSNWVISLYVPCNATSSYKEKIQKKMDFFFIEKFLSHSFVGKRLCFVMLNTKMCHFMAFSFVGSPIFLSPTFFYDGFMDIFIYTNMAGKYNGVTQKILEKNKFAKFTKVSQNYHGGKILLTGLKPGALWSEIWWENNVQTQLASGTTE
ncbi:hypothetical protein GQR58_024145 [Nymphon striatum]|nr:hypothetical protein GQR58_024145 [Nymphon striatum]